MNTDAKKIDQDTLDQLEERLKRGIPNWEQGHFIEMVVPQLVARLKAYMTVDAKAS